ncbi:MAG: hypothetical protein FWD74_06315 [Actinomycetia bacterium]|nr:hypothetical protein [Actinomycetes bacterium]
MALAYSIFLPRPWIRVPVREDTDRELDKLVAASLDKLPPQIGPDQKRQLQIKLANKLGSALADARARGAVDLYLPTEPWHGVLTGASFIVAEIEPPIQPPAEITSENYAPLVMAELLDDPDARTVETAAGIWVRTEGVEPAGGEVDVPTAVVTYLMPIPGAAGCWVTVSFSTFGDGKPDSELTRLIVELFDAIMTTWEWPPGGEP